MRVRFHAQASEEAERAQAWYEERSVLAGAGFLQELSQSIQRITVAPRRYPVAMHGTRRVLFHRFPFSLYYRASEDEILVVDVAHHKRRPGYWTGR